MSGNLSLSPAMYGEERDNLAVEHQIRTDLQCFRQRRLDIAAITGAQFATTRLERRDPVRDHGSNTAALLGRADTASGGNAAARRATPLHGRCDNPEWANSVLAASGMIGARLFIERCSAGRDLALAHLPRTVAFARSVQTSRLSWFAFEILMPSSHAVG